jgi:hypothetical protein
MLTYNMDVEERSTWLRATPGAAALAAVLLHRGRQLLWPRPFCHSPHR